MQAKFWNFSLKTVEKKNASSQIKTSEHIAIFEENFQKKKSENCRRKSEGEQTTDLESRSMPHQIKPNKAESQMTLASARSSSLEERWVFI